METVKGLNIVILLYFIILFLSPAIYYTVCNHLGYGFQSTVATGAIAYASYSLGIGFLLKYGFDCGLFEIAYVYIINIFPFAFFYVLGLVALQGAVKEASLIITFLNC